MSIDNNVVYKCFHTVADSQAFIRYCDYRVYFAVYKNVLRGVELDIHALCEEIKNELNQKHE
jgi:hypothetical protein